MATKEEIQREAEQRLGAVIDAFAKDYGLHQMIVLELFSVCVVNLAYQIGRSIGAEISEGNRRA